MRAAGLISVLMLLRRGYNGLAASTFVSHLQGWRLART